MCTWVDGWREARRKRGWVVEEEEEEGRGDGGVAFFLRMGLRRSIMTTLCVGLWLGVVLLGWVAWSWWGEWMAHLWAQPPCSAQLMPADAQVAPNLASFRGLVPTISRQPFQDHSSSTWCRQIQQRPTSPGQARSPSHDFCVAWGSCRFLGDSGRHLAGLPPNPPQPTHPPHTQTREDGDARRASSTGHRRRDVGGLARGHPTRAQRRGGCRCRRRRRRRGSG